MRFSRTSSLLIALFLTALLPLRGYAAVAHCDAAAGPGAAHAMHLSHCTDTVHPHTCSDCCIVAVLPAPIDSHLPPSPPAAPAAIFTSAPRAPALDRLDRPPRTPP
jgi:hypothetical protein